MSGVTGIELGPNYCVSSVFAAATPVRSRPSRRPPRSCSLRPAIGRVACTGCERPVSAAIFPAARAWSRGDRLRDRPE